jgi:hypothetical protein
VKWAPQETGVNHELDDTELERQLRRVAERVEPVPPALLQAAFDAYTWRTVDAELAELVFDSLADHEAAALVRGTEEGRLLSFETGDLTIEVEVTGAGPARQLIGQLMPAQPATIDIRRGQDTTRVTTDELGRFTVAGLRAGPVSLRCSAAAGPGEKAHGRTIVTDWVSI